MDMIYPGLRELLQRALAEDVGHGDVTTQLTVPAARRGRARILVKGDGPVVFCGGALVAEVCALAGARPEIAHLAQDGARLEPGEVAAEFAGPLASLLTAERTLLNFLQLMSGIATATAAYVAAVRGTGATIIDTRKTHPGLRTLEKYAVRVGGGANHRYGLDSGVLIKDNHIVAAGSVEAAVGAARRGAPHTLKIQIECETIAQVEQALAAGADVLLLDNMTLANIQQAVSVVRACGRVVPLEVSGNVTLDTVRAIAETGVDLISVGAITHSVHAADLSMRIENLT
jgi:nicotinate-nucleotide pyrophosphorylase (carboxylating)